MDIENRAVSAVIAGLLLTWWTFTPPMTSPAHAQTSGNSGQRTVAGDVIAPLPSPSVVLRDFRAPLSEWGPGHRGVDLAATDGEVILSPVAGTIVFSGLVALKPEVSVMDTSGHRFSMEPACGVLPPGSLVTAGTLLGTVCATGYVSHCAPLLCLHFSVRNQAGYLSPLWLMGQSGPSRLAK